METSGALRPALDGAMGGAARVPALRAPRRDLHCRELLHADESLLAAQEAFTNQMSRERHMLQLLDTTETMVKHVEHVEAQERARIRRRKQAALLAKKAERERAKMHMKKVDAMLKEIGDKRKRMASLSEATSALKAGPAAYFSPLRSRPPDESQARSASRGNSRSPSQATGLFRKPLRKAKSTQTRDHETRQQVCLANELLRDIGHLR